VFLPQKEGIEVSNSLKMGFKLEQSRFTPWRSPLDDCLKTCRTYARK